MQAEEKIAALIENLTRWLESSKNFAVEQAPEVVQQMISIEIWSSWIGVSLSIVGLLLCAPLFFKYLRKTKESYDGDDIFYSIPSAFLGIFAFASIPALLINAMNLVRVYVAPKVFVIQNVGKLLGGE